MRHDRLVAGPEERADQELDQLVRPVAEDHLILPEAVLLGERLTEVEPAPVGIAVQVDERGGDGFTDAIRRRQWIFVRGQLDGVVDAQLAFELLDRLPGLVGSDPEDVVVGE